MRFVGLAVVVAACAYHAPGDQPVGDDAPAGADAPAPDAMPDAFVCPAGYVALAGAPSLYRVSGGGGSVTDNAGRTSWVGAEADCRDDGVGTHLAIAETEAEYKAFSDAVSGATRWLGVSDRKTEGTWIPIIGGTTTSFIGHWFNGDPNNTCCDATSDCMTLSGSQQGSALGTINISEGMPCADVTAPHVKGYICECDMLPVDTSTF